MKISIALATYNESHNISECLKSVDWADEIVIVDGSSTDNTVELARKNKKCKIIITDNKPIFHINKQMAISACKGDWILQIDADERVSPELKEEIIKTIESNPINNGFWIPRSNYFLGRFLKKGGQYPDYTIRLYKNGFGHLPAKNVHEQAAIKGSVGYLSSPLLHFADTSFSRYLLRNNRYTTLIAQELKDQDTKINFLNFIVYFCTKPIWEFLQIYLLHRGYVDGFAGFVFSLFSSLRFPIAYIKLYELNSTKNNINLKKDWD